MTERTGRNVLTTDAGEASRTPRTHGPRRLEGRSGGWELGREGGRGV
jgi:hypothetical protein